MLFDLRGRGRRRVVRVVYTGLALLLGVGLVGFGVGGGFGSGGLFSSIGNSEGANSASFSAQIKKYEKLTREQPKSLSAWENLTKNLLHEAGGEQYVTSAGVMTSKGKEIFNRAAQAWTSYNNLNPPTPNLELSKQMARIYGEYLNQPSQAVQALQTIVAAEPTNAAWYSQLAIYAYRAHNTRVGDLASTKAVSLSPSSERTRVKNALAEAKANPSGEKAYTVTTNGKTYVGKLNSKGEIKAVQQVTTPKSTTKSSTTSAGTTSTGTSTAAKKK
jgi:hypothetical protein